MCGVTVMRKNKTETALSRTHTPHDPFVAGRQGLEVLLVEDKVRPTAGAAVLERAAVLLAPLAYGLGDRRRAAEEDPDLVVRVLRLELLQDAVPVRPPRVLVVVFVLVRSTVSITTVVVFVLLRSTVSITTVVVFCIVRGTVIITTVVVFVFL